MPENGVIVRQKAKQTKVCSHCSKEQKGDHMKKNFGKQVRRRCMSVVLASALVICTPAADTFSAAGIIPGIMQKAKAASGQIDNNGSVVKTNI